MNNKTKVFIDGESGTTGLEIRSHLELREDIELIKIEKQYRKSSRKRAICLNEADICILCLPDEAAREAVQMIKNSNTVIIDTSTAHRVSNGWCYGFPEYDESQRAKIRESNRIANPGCYAIGAIALLHPLLRRKLITEDHGITITGLSGYSGGGKNLIKKFKRPEPEESLIYDYALNLDHKHLPEIKHWSPLVKNPIFIPCVGNYFRGMLVRILLPFATYKQNCSADHICEALMMHYKDEKFIKVIINTHPVKIKEINPQELNHTNNMNLIVSVDRNKENIALTAQFDNLGKGASRQALQTLSILIDKKEGLANNQLKKRGKNETI